MRKKYVKNIKVFLVIFLLIISQITFVFAETKLPSPSHEFYVYDETETLSKKTKDYIISINEKLEQKTGSQIVVAIVHDLDDLTIDKYALHLFRKWGIGDKEKNNGILFLISKNDRQVRIEVGYGLEGTLSDGKIGKLLDDYVVPNLKENDYEKGISDGFTALVQAVGDEYEINIDGLEELPKKSTLDIMFAIILIVILTIIVFIAIIANNDDFSSGSSGGSWSSSSSGNSSSFGGGGSSGGGGASRGF